jgi:MraZ protein
MFLSSYENKLDKKGRVSVPATFRSHLTSQGYNSFITYPSFNHSALEGCSQDRIEKLSKSIDTLNPFEEKRDYIATSILSESVNLNFDTEGRVLIPNKLLSHARIRNNILFVGLGETFQIWDPKIFEKFKSTARKKAFQNRSKLTWEKSNNKKEKV